MIQIIQPKLEFSKMLKGGKKKADQRALSNEHIHEKFCRIYRASLVAQRLKQLPPMWETQVRFLGWEDSPREENGNPLQYSCLENPMDGEAW